MLAHCPFPSDSEMNKKERGKFTSFVHKELNVQFTKWIDNKCVVMGSNSIPDSPPGECQRWSRSTKQYITIKRPRSIESYNSFMGGTDAMDQSINCYKPSIRNRKWYFPIFTFVLMTSLYNGWKLKRRFDNLPNEPFLEFIRYIVKTYLIVYKTARKKGRRTNAMYASLRVPKRVADSVRYDGVNHFMGNGETRTRCALCGKHTFKLCLKCGVKLHVGCFASFHGHRE